MLPCLIAAFWFLAQITLALPAPHDSLPKDGRKRLELAANVNGLDGLAIPWHVTARFEVFGPDGSLRDKGTFEEWRVSSRQYRVALHANTIVTDEYGTQRGVFRSGEQEWPRKPLSSIRRLITQPVPNELPGTAIFENFQRGSSDNKIPCTAVMRRGFEQTPRGSPYFCFAAANAGLVYMSTANAAQETEFTRLELFEGRYVAYEIEQFLGGYPWLKIHVDSLNKLDKADYAALAVPPGASPVVPRLDLTGKLDQVNAINKVSPQYPAKAIQKGIQGTVIVNGILDKDGRLRDLRVLSGPPALQQSALEAVRQWTYHPFLVDGQPYEVEMDIGVDFHLRTLGYPLQ